MTKRTYNRVTRSLLVPRPPWHVVTERGFLVEISRPGVSKSHKPPHTLIAAERIIDHWPNLARALAEDRDR